MDKIKRFIKRKFRKNAIGDSKSLDINQLRKDIKEESPIIVRLEEKMLDFIKYRKDIDTEEILLENLWEEFYYHLLAFSERNDIDNKFAANKFMNKTEIYESIKFFEPKGFIMESELYRSFPSDLVHLLMCKDVYEDNHYDKKASKEKIDFNGEDWIVNEVYIENSNILEMCKFKAVVYTNNEFRQMVVAFKGLEPKLSDIFNKEGGLKNNLEAIFFKGSYAQLLKCFHVTEASYNSAKNRNYNLSFTGFSNGAWLAEHAVNFIPYIDSEFKPSKVKAILFDSHGITKEGEKTKEKDANIFKEKTELWDMSDNITCYLSNPNFANSSNKHNGNIFRIFIDYKEENFDEENKIIMQIKEWIDKSKTIMGFFKNKLNIGVIGTAGQAINNAVSIGSNAASSVLSKKNLIQNLKFFLIGLKSLFNPKIIDKNFNHL
jgi:hypothetical protein